MRIIRFCALFLFFSCFFETLLFSEQKKSAENNKGKNILSSCFPYSSDSASEASLKLRKLLSDKKISFNFDEAPFTLALDLLRRQGITILISSANNAKDAIADATVTMTVHKMNTGDALGYLTEYHGFKYQIKNGILVVNNGNELKTPDNERVYSVRDIVKHVKPESLVKLIKSISLPGKKGWDGKTNSVTIDKSGWLAVTTYPETYDTIKMILKRLKKNVRVYSDLRENHGHYPLDQRNMKTEKLLLSKKISLDLRKMEFEKALDILRKKGLKIKTPDGIKIKNKDKIGMNLKETSLLNALETIAAFHDLDFKIKEGGILLFQKKEELPIKENILNLKKDIEVLKAKVEK